jgi:DNA modification methylase
MAHKNATERYMITHGCRNSETFKLILVAPSLQGEKVILPMPIQPVQLDLFGSFQNLGPPEKSIFSCDYKGTLRELFAEDLDFHGENSGYATHNFHAFPAKFPPQLPRKFIVGLTMPGETVLDPMSGSGTAVLESMLLGRHGIGVDIDPLALAMGKVKVTPVDLGELMKSAGSVTERATHKLRFRREELESALATRFDSSTKKFADYWFLEETQLELLALIREIEGISDHNIRRFLEIALSSIIITKSGGVSLAYDLAHTRPHRLADKVPRSPIDKFEKRLNKNLKQTNKLAWSTGQACLLCGNAQKLGIADNCIDLIITSPPYAANAIDYMRAHKFSLVWFGHKIETLGKMRGDYIGGERIHNFQMAELPAYVEGVVLKLAEKDPKKGSVLRRYYTEMTLCLSEMFRVLKPGKAAIVIIGSSIMRGIDSETATCLGEIGKTIAFELVDIAERRLDRNRRMMPARKNALPESQIEERMHKEYVIGFYKPK